jgi:hypothetical protein
MLSPLPSSPILADFEGDLLEPEAEDRPWLLLPGLRVDPRARVLRRVIGIAPELFPGFFNFPTPDRHAKRAKLEEVRSALHATIGKSLTDNGVRRLLTQPDGALEAKLLADASTPEERIGIGLALSRFRRARWQSTADEPAGLAGTRGAALARERNDMMARDAP